jgi:hypothetical protein
MSGLKRAIFLMGRTWRAPCVKIALLLAATVLFLGILEDWAGGSRTEAAENVVFVISNAL